MNLSQVVWYSVAIGFVIFISLLSVSYISYRVKQSRIRIKMHLNDKQYSKAGIMHNRNMRFIPQKVAYVKKHSEIKETFSYSARMLEERERREVEKRSMERKLISNKTKERFTVVNDSPAIPGKGFQYIPSQVRSDNGGEYRTGTFTTLIK